MRRAVLRLVDGKDDFLALEGIDRDRAAHRYATLLAALERCTVLASPRCNLTHGQRTRGFRDARLRGGVDPALCILDSGASTCLRTQTDAGGNARITRDSTCDCCAGDAGHFRCAGA